MLALLHASTPMIPLGLAAALGLVHLGAGRLRFLDGIPRSRWLSFASGISVAYVFVHLLPELAEGQHALAESELNVAVEGAIWLLALAGLVAFYGLERAAKGSRDDGPTDRTEAAVFRLHMASYALYNTLIGYLLARSDGLSLELFLFWFAMALHFLVNDYGLRDHHKERYTRTGRWVLTAAVVAGALVGLWVTLPEAAIAGLVGVLAGGVVLNVLKEELPDERESRFGPFLLGAAAYAALLAAV